MPELLRWYNDGKTNRLQTRERKVIPPSGHMIGYYGAVEAATGRIEYTEWVDVPIVYANEEKHNDTKK